VRAGSCANIGQDDEVETPALSAMNAVNPLGDAM